MYCGGIACGPALWFSCVAARRPVSTIPVPFPDSGRLHRLQTSRATLGPDLGAAVQAPKQYHE